MTKETLQQNITERLNQEKGVFAVAFKDLSSGDTLYINAKENFHAASTMKTPVLIEVYKQAAAGNFSLTDSVTIKNEFKSIVDSSTYSLRTDDDSDTGLYKRIGEKILIKDLVYEMITVSSNLATNMLIEIVDARKVTETMRNLGAQDIQVLRGVEDNKAYEKGLSNTTTAYDLAIIFEKIATGKTVDSIACKEMMDILKDQHFKEIIPARLPAGVIVAHKTGFITGVRHDSGIIFLPDGRTYVLVLLSKELDNPDGGVKAMAEVSEMIYKYKIGQSQ